MTHQEYVNQIQRSLGKGNNCLGGNYYFDFSNEELDKFLQNMSSIDRNKFNELVCNYYVYMESLSFLRGYKIKEGDSVVTYFYYNVWSNIAISIIFSLIEKTISKSQISFVNFLKNNFEKIKTPSDIDALSKEHKKLNYSIADYIFSFYSNNLSENDRGILKKCFKSRDFKKIIKDNLYGKMRSNLVHSLDIKSLPQYEVGFSKKGDVFELSDELNAERFVYLSWKAVFKYFGYSKDL